MFRSVLDPGLKVHTFSNKKLPISMNPFDFGEVISTSEIPNGVRYVVTDKIKVYSIDSIDNGKINKVQILGIANIKWTDTALNDGFKKKIGKSTIYFLDGEIV